MSGQKIYRRLFSDLLFLLFLSFSLFANAKPITINTGFSSPQSDMLKEIMQLTFDTAGIELDFNVRPAERSLVLVADGIDDGECCRIPRFIRDDYPDLIQIPEYIYISKFSAFARKPAPKIKNYESLAPYSVATVAGWKLLVNQLRNVSPKTFHVVDDGTTVFELLRLGRIDFAVYGYLSGAKIIKQGKYDNIEAVKPPLSTEKLFLFLNAENKHLAAPLLAAIKKLKSQNKIQKIIDRYENNQLKGDD